MSGARPRLLFLCQTFPYPPDGGVWIRTYNVLRQLAAQFEITLLCFERALSPADGFVFDREASLAALNALASTYVFPIPQRDSRVRYFWDHARSLFQRRVYTDFLYDSQPFRRRLAELLATRSFDLVHLDSLDLAAYLPLLAGLPVVCVHHNVESELLRRRAAAEPHSAGRAYVNMQARLMERSERRWCDRVALNVVVSERDGERLRQIAPGARITVVPNGVDLDHFRPAPGPTSGLAFVGGTNWFPNRDALEFFSDEILPRLKQQGNPKVRWIGAAQREERALFAARGVELTGYVEDIRPLVQSARCYVVPLRVGGGSRLKILDAWAMGKAVVSTSLGCEGLAARHENNILIADTPATFAAAVQRVIGDEGLAERLGEAARVTVEREYGWEALGRRMIPEYVRLLRTSGAALAPAGRAPGTA